MVLRFFRLSLAVFAPAFALIGALRLLASLAPPSPQVVFSATFDDGEALYLYDVARAQMYRLADHSAYVIPDVPAWSADGQQLAYVSADPGANEAESIYTYSLHTRQLQLVYPAASGDLIIQPPLWSPQADMLVFTLEAQGADDVQLIRLGVPSGETSATALEGAETRNHALRWLPSDRLRYVEISETRVRMQDISLADFSAQTLQEWAVDFRNWWEPVLSPEGDRFVVPAVAPGIATYDLFRFDLSQDVFLNLTQRTTSNETQPAWSNDGTRIAYKLLTDGQFIMVASAEGGEPAPLFGHPTARLSDIRWSPDDTQLSFLMNAPDRVDLCVLDIATEAVVCPLSGTEIEEVVWR